VQYGCFIVASLLGGWLATVWFGWTALSCAFALFLVVPVGYVTIREPRAKVSPDDVLRTAGRQLKRIAAAKSMWAAGGLMALVYVAPGFTTVLFYKQQTELHMAPPAQGVLNTIMAAGAIAGAFAYTFACRRFRLRTLLLASLSIAAVATLAYFFYTSPANARIIAALEGFGTALATMAMVDLSVRATPAGSEGLGYALMISINNFARLGSDWVGSAMLDRLHLPFSALVLINAGTTLVAVPLVFLLPKTLVLPRETEARTDAMLIAGYEQEGAFDAPT
jgi:predicted MFS family arabinose efflux permease